MLFSESSSNNVNRGKVEPASHALPINADEFANAETAAERIVSDTLKSVKKSDPLLFKQFMAEGYKALLVNAVRDFVWAYISSLQNPIPDDAAETGNFVGSTRFDLKESVEQWALSTAAMLTVSLIAAGAQTSTSGKQANFKAFCTNIKPWFVATLAASLPIIPWNAGQALGYYLFGTALTGACLTGIFTGLGEGWIQHVTFDIADRMEKTKGILAKTKPCATATQYSAELFTSLSVGSIPGGVWQVAWAVGRYYHWSKESVSALVSGSVATANAAYGLFTENAFSGLSACLGLNEEKVEDPASRPLLPATTA